MRNRRDNGIIAGWNSERFARTKLLQDLPEYLKPAPTDAHMREEGASKVLAMFKRLARKKG